MKDVRLVIGEKNYSSWSLCPWLLLKMFNIDFEEISVALYQKSTAERLGPYSPSLKVPVLLHKDITVWDSLAICEYISVEILGDVGWPVNKRKRASARSVSSEIHADFPDLKREWPMNCKSQFKLTPSDKVMNEIARIDAIWNCCRHKFGENGDYLFGRFSIADCMFAPIAICFKAYGAPLSVEAQHYCDTLTNNPFVQSWASQGRTEQEPLSIAYASNM
ncbi:MAG: glutathione S-transferase family protein [Gammaproteobacteria bacterium]|nr:glutathione S-transferase family protein [Gammaproteobacteria bacterium]